MIIFLLSDRRASRTEEIEKYGKRIFCKTRLFNVYLFVFSTLIIYEAPNWLQKKQRIQNMKVMSSINGTLVKTIRT